LDREWQLDIPDTGIVCDDETANTDAAFLNFQGATKIMAGMKLRAKIGEGW
jgi:hypothetical protein